MPTDKPRKDIRAARNRIIPQWANFLFGLEENEGYHNVHHLFPRVGSHNLKAAHQVLLEDKEYAKHCNTSYTLTSLIAELLRLSEKGVRN